MVVPLSRVVFGNDDTIRRARLEFIMTRPSFSIIPSSGFVADAVFPGNGEGLIIRKGALLNFGLDVFVVKFCPIVGKLSMGINAMCPGVGEDFELERTG